MDPSDMDRLSEIERLSLDRQRSESIGYFRAKLETLDAKIDYHIALKQKGEEEYHLRKKFVDERMERMEEHLKKEIGELKDQLSIYKSFIKFVKVIGMILVAIFTFKLGDVGDLIKGLIK